MDILQIRVSQRKLKRFRQIEKMVEAIKNGEELPKILLDEEFVLLDGHHRLAAYYLAERKELNFYEFLVLQQDSRKPSFGNIECLLRYCGVNYGFSFRSFYEETSAQG